MSMIFFAFIPRLNLVIQKIDVMGSLSSLKQAVLKWHQYSDVTAVMIGYRLKVLFCTRKNLEIKQATENQALLSCWILHSILRGKNSFYLAVNFYQLMMSSNRQVDLLIQIRTVNILLGLRVKYMLINIAKMIKSVFLISRTLSAKYLLFSTKSSAVRDNGILFSNWVFASCPCDCRTFESPVHQFQIILHLLPLGSMDAPHYTTGARTLAVRWSESSTENHDPCLLDAKGITWVYIHWPDIAWSLKVVCLFASWDPEVGFFCWDTDSFILFEMSTDHLLGGGLRAFSNIYYPLIWANKNYIHFVRRWKCLRISELGLNKLFFFFFFKSDPHCWEKFWPLDKCSWWALH